MTIIEIELREQRKEEWEETIEIDKIMSKGERDNRADEEKRGGGGRRRRWWTKSSKEPFK